MLTKHGGVCASSQCAFVAQISFPFQEAPRKKKHPPPPPFPKQIHNITHLAIQSIILSIPVQSCPVRRYPARRQSQSQSQSRPSARVPRSQCHR